MRPELINPLALAYLGDGVFEVYVREYLMIEKNITKPDLLQKAAVHFVSAKAQAEFMKEAIINQWVNEKEISIYKRGRNATCVGTFPVISQGVMRKIHVQ